MNYTKRKPLHAECEHITSDFIITGVRYSNICGKPAKAERYFEDQKAKPMPLCGIHANQALRRGLDVRYIGETK